MCSGLFRWPPRIARFSDVFCAGAPARSVTARAPRGASPSSAHAPCARSRPAPLASPRPPASTRTAPRGASSGSAGQSGGRPPGVVPEGHRKLAGGAARNERNHRTLHKSAPAPEGRWNLHGPLHPIAPAGAGLILSSIRWFPLADSLHHRLISAAPPAHSRCLCPRRTTSGRFQLPLTPAHSCCLCPRRTPFRMTAGFFYETAAAFYARFGFEPTAAPGTAADARRALSRRDIGN